MGQKLSTDTSNWSADDWAYGTGENVVPLDEVVEEAKQVPMKYFGGKAIGNDASMQQMQQDLLQFDQKLKKLLFWRKKNKNKKYDLGEQQQQQQQEYYDGNPQTIEEEQEEQQQQELPPIYVNQDPISSDWICEVCQAQNKFANIECEQCKQTSTF